MQPRHPFTVFFFLQPCSCLFPLPCTKATTRSNGLKLKHLNFSGWSHCILRIAFIMCTCKYVWWDGIPLGKGCKMGRVEPPRLGVEKYREIQNAYWSAKVQVHSKNLGKVLLKWDFGVSIEDALRIQGGYLQKIIFFEIVWITYEFLNHCRPLFPLVDYIHSHSMNSDHPYLAKSYTFIDCTLGNSSKHLHE
jgi:hypothetical protein